MVDGSTVYLFRSWNGGGYNQPGKDTLPDGSITKPIDTTWAGRRHLYLTVSTDDGNTWSTPKDVTTTLPPQNWSWDAVGPGIGIKLTTGELVVPAQKRNLIGRGPTGNRTWTMQEVAGGGSQSTIAQTPDGGLYRNDRSPGKTYRKVARGTLSGFGTFSEGKGPPDPACEGSVLLYNHADSGPVRTIFINSASQSSRRQMRVRISYNQDVARWDFGRELVNAKVSGAGYEGGY